MLGNSCAPLPFQQSLLIFWSIVNKAEHPLNGMVLLVIILNSCKSSNTLAGDPGSPQVDDHQPSSISGVRLNANHFIQA